MTAADPIEDPSEQPAIEMPPPQLALALLRAAERSDESGVWLRPEALGIPFDLVERFVASECEHGPNQFERLLALCRMDGFLLVALDHLKTGLLNGRKSGSGTYKAGWQAFYFFAKALLRQPSRGSTDKPAEALCDGTWRESALAMLKRACDQATPDTERPEPSGNTQKDKDARLPSSDAKSALCAHPGAMTREKDERKRLVSHTIRQSSHYLGYTAPADGDALEILRDWRISIGLLRGAASRSLDLSQVYHIVGQEFKERDFTSLTRRVRAEAGRRGLDTAPISDVFGIYYHLSHNGLTFGDEESTGSKEAWFHFCRKGLNLHERLETRVNETVNRLMALLDAEAFDKEKTPASSQPTGVLPHKQHGLGEGLSDKTGQKANQETEGDAKAGVAVDILSDDSMMTWRAFADILKLDKKDAYRLKTRLHRYKTKHLQSGEGWKEVENSDTKECRFVFRVKDVRYLLRDFEQR